MKNNLCTVRTSYNFYKNNSDNPLSFKKYIYIVYGFFKFLLNEIFLTKETQIPCKLGSLQVIGKKRVGKLDENGRPIYNEDGKVMKGPKYFKPDLSKFIK